VQTRRHNVPRISCRPIQRLDVRIAIRVAASTLAHGLSACQLHPIVMQPVGGRNSLGVSDSRYTHL
jgi:hypothetical protein